MTVADEKSTAEPDSADQQVAHSGRRFVGRSAVGFVVLALVALAVAALFFVASGLVVEVDRATAAFLNSVVAPRPAAVTALQIVAGLGEDLTGWVVLGTLALFLLLRRQHRLAAFVVVSGLGAAVLSPTIKALVGRVRPIVADPVAIAPGPSFPSGHAVTATVMIGLLLLVFLPTAPARARRPLVVLGAVLVVLVAFTRIALGVHFLSDVLAGVVLAGGWLAVTASAFRTWRREEGLPVRSVERGLEPEAADDLTPAPDTGSAPSGSGAPHPWAVAARLLVTAVLLLGLTLAVGLLITQVLAGTPVERADLGIDQWFAAHRTPTLDAISFPAAEFGNTTIVICGGLIAMALALAGWRRWRPALVVAVAIAGEFAIFMTSVLTIGRPRPQVSHLDAALPPTSSFPSGHTAAAIALYGSVAALVLLGTRAWWRWLVLALAVGVIVMVALARLYRGAHFPTDVLGSVLFTVPWLLITLRVLDPFPERSAPAVARPSRR